MATYVMLGKYSAEGMKGASANRTAEAKAVFAKYGGQMKAVYGLLGDTDLLVIADFPGTAEAMKTSVALTRLTGIGFATSPAVTVEELDKLLSEL